MSQNPRTQWALVVLSFGSGATDAFAFLALGGVFTANMTGNLVLVGLVGRPDYPTTLLAAAVAVVAFLVALFAGFRATRTPARPRIRGLLAATASVQVVVVLLWWLAGAEVDLLLQCLLIVLSAIAMGFHTVLGRRLSARAGLSTTFVTGTLTALVQDLSEGRSAHQPLRVASIAALVVGSLAGASLLLWVPQVGPVLPVAAAILALALVARSGLAPA